MQQTKVIKNKKIKENELVEAFDAETIKCLLKSEEDIKNGSNQGKIWLSIVKNLI